MFRSRLAQPAPHGAEGTASPHFDGTATLPGALCRVRQVDVVGRVASHSRVRRPLNYYVDYLLVVFDRVLA